MEGFLISEQVGTNSKLPARTRSELASDDLFLLHELQPSKNWKNRPKKIPLSGPDFWPEIGFSLEGLPGRAWRLEETESKELGRASPRWNAHH